MISGHRRLRGTKKAKFTAVRSFVEPMTDADLAGELGAQLPHVGEFLGVDHVIRVTCPEQFEEVEPAFAARRAEPGETVIADLRADGVGATMPRTGVVHRDPLRRFQPGEIDPVRDPSAATRHTRVGPASAVAA